MQHGDADRTLGVVLRPFERYVGASGVTDDSQKRRLLLHCAGEGVQSIFYTLTDTIIPVLGTKK